jgi:predicted transposase YbfD/YdcC
MVTSTLPLQVYLHDLKDPRRCPRHRLLDIVVIAVCAVICGANDWQQIVTFGEQRRDWLARFLALPHGIPSHDTFERLFARLKPRALTAALQRWTQALAEGLGLKQIAIDGKTLRGSAAATKGLGPLHLVSAWATAHHLSLGQVAVDSKSNEITAIPELLELLDVRGALVTIDAMGCQKAIAQQIKGGGGDYVLTVKDNQEHLLADIRQALVAAEEQDFAGLEHDTFETQERGHGRDEYRSYLVLHDTAGIRQAASWCGLTTIGVCYSTRTVGDATSEETRYFMGSRKASAQVYGQALRHHWGIENNLHWQLDVTFREDSSRIQERQAAENFASIRKLALALLKRHPNKQSIACKRLHAALDVDFLEEIVSGPTAHL